MPVRALTSKPLLMPMLQVTPEMYFALVISGVETLHTVARSRAEALDQFGRALGKRLTDSETPWPTKMLLDEFENSPHWINANIPVWEKCARSSHHIKLVGNEDNCDR